MNNTINQSLALGKRSMASKENGEYASFAAKRAKASDTTKTKTRDDNGGKVVVGFGSVLKRPTTSKLKKVGKPEISRTTTNSTINKVTESTKNIKLPNESVVLPVPLAKPKESTAAKPLTAPVITLDDDEDESELLGDEWKGEIKSDVEGEDDDDDDAIFNLEYELSDDSQSPNSNVAPNETASISGSETVAQRAKKVARPPKMCEVCGKVVSAKLFKEHMIMHSDPESMTCSCCGKLFSTVSTLKKHFIWTHTSLRPFMCDLCGNTFKRNDHLKLHREHFHANENTGGTAVKCGVCGVSVKTMVSLQSHMKRVHGEKKVGTYDKDLNHKILADKSYECGICSLNFKQFSYLRIHIKFVHEKGLPWHINQGASGPYKCEPCKSTYATLQSLREHNRRRHDGAPVEKFQKECSHCGMVYRNRLHYSKHLAKLSGRPTCYVCWNDFDSAEDLKVHINSEHLDELPFGCELCGVRFVYLTELRNHMYTHSKTKQFHCDQCPQSFVRKDFLKSHKRRHAGIRNHTCTECNKSFVEFCDLRKHMQVHFKNKIPISQVKTEITTN